MGFENPIVSVIQPANLLTNGNLVAGLLPGSAVNIDVTPQGDTLSLEIAVEFRWTYVVTGIQTGTVYARSTISATPPILTTPFSTIIDINPAVDTSYEIEFSWEGTGNSLASPYWVTQRTNEYKIGVTGGADYANSNPVPVRESCPALLFGTASISSGSAIIVPAIVGPGIGGLTYYPRIWSLTLISQQPANGLLFLTDNISNFFGISGGQSINITPMGLIIPTTAALRIGIGVATGSCTGLVLYDYAPVI